MALASPPAGQASFTLQKMQPAANRTLMKSSYVCRSQSRRLITGPARQNTFSRMQSDAALPWASAHQQHNEQDAQEVAEVVETDLPLRLGLQLGAARLEVKWQLEEEETGEAFTKWWGAELHSRMEGKTDGEGRQVYLLRYDPDPEHGFDEHECCEVTFVEEHLLYDLEREDDLAWRLAGDSWDEPQLPEGDGETEGAQGAVYSLNEIAAAIKASERRRGRTVEQDVSEALSELPQEKQMFIAAGFRSFSDRITAGVAELQARHGSDYVVTAADVKAVTSAAMRAAMQDSGLRGGL